MNQLLSSFRRRPIVHLIVSGFVAIFASACGGGGGTTIAPGGSLSTSVCSAYIRGFNANNPNTASPVDIEINGSRRFINIAFRGVTNYISVPPGSVTIRFFQAGTNTVVAGGERQFSATSNLGYTVAATGSVPGPSNQLLFNSSPFVYPENLAPPNPGKFRGKWYRGSETTLVIDFRIYNPATPAVDVTRLTNLNPKTMMEYAEIDPGTYNFDPVGVGSSDPLVNQALSPPATVRVSATVPAGVLFDVFASGNPFGTPPNSLQLVSATTRTAFDANGCITVQ